MATEEQREKIKNLHTRIAEEPDNLELRMELGSAYMLLGHYHFAQLQFRTVLTHDPKYADAYDAYIDAMKSSARALPQIKDGIERMIEEVIRIGIEHGVYSEGAERFA